MCPCATAGGDSAPSCPGPRAGGGEGSPRGFGWASGPWCWSRKKAGRARRAWGAPPSRPRPPTTWIGSRAPTARSTPRRNPGATARRATRATSRPRRRREAGMRKLHRLAGQKKIAGVCAGLGEYFEIDPLFFRLFFLVSLLFGGIGALVYLLLWVMVPEKAGADGGGGAAKGLRLSRSDRKIAGVCGGLGQWAGG